MPPVAHQRQRDRRPDELEQREQTVVAGGVVSANEPRVAAGLDALDDERVRAARGRLRGLGDSVAVTHTSLPAAWGARPARSTGQPT